MPARDYNVRVDVYHHADPEIVNRKLDTVIDLLRASAVREIHMANELADLETQVAETTTVEQSAVVLLQGLKAALDAAGTDPAKLAALRSSLDSSETALAEAITANTPSA